MKFLLLFWLRHIGVSYILKVQKCIKYQTCFNNLWEDRHLATLAYFGQSVYPQSVNLLQSSNLITTTVNTVLVLVSQGSHGVETAYWHCTPLLWNHNRTAPQMLQDIRAVICVKWSNILSLYCSFLCALSNVNEQFSVQHNYFIYNDSWYSYMLWPTISHLQAVKFTILCMLYITFLLLYSLKVT